MYWIKQVKESGTSGFSMLIFASTRTYALSHIYVLDCIYVYLLEHMCTWLHTFVPYRTYVYSIVHMCTLKYGYSCIYYLSWSCILLLETCFAKLLFLGIPKYLAKNKLILLEFAQKRFYIELWYLIQVNLSNYSSVQDIMIYHYLSRFIIILGIP